MSTDNCIAVALYLNGRTELSTAISAMLAAQLKVTPRSIYRYLEHIDRARFLLGKLKI